MSAAAIRGDWVGRIIDGRFPLLQWLGGSAKSFVFLTEFGEPARKATIKLIPDDSENSKILLAACEAAASLQHPHLMQVFGYRRCYVGADPYIYVVKEFADEVLAEILRERPLTPEETRDMLGPALDALAYLHSKGFVHCRLRPSNIMAVGDSLKLSCDSPVSAGATRILVAERTVYDAPETAGGPVQPPADVWSLGVTLVEVLTQHPPVWDREAQAEPTVPDSIPQPFAELARECLRIDPARRCTIARFKAWLVSGAVPSVPPVAVPSPQPRPAPPLQPKDRFEPESTSRSRAPLIAGIAFLIAAVFIWQLRSCQEREESPGPAQQTTGTQRVEPSRAAPKPEAAHPAAPKPAASGHAASKAGVTAGAVTQQVRPDVLPTAMQSIRGLVKLTVRLAVDANGNVTNASLESAGPSKYFANKALEAAWGWKFKAAQVNGRAAPSSWLLHYEFTQGGINVAPEETTP